MTILLAAALLVGASQLGADSLVTKCSQPKNPPLGILRGAGVVRVEVSKSGRADTQTVKVVESSRLSAPAFRSAVIRVLLACRYKDEEGRLPAEITQRFQFDTSGFVYGAASLTPGALNHSDTLNATPTSEPGKGPYANANPPLEERPRPLACRVADPPPMMGSGVEAIARQQHMREGWARLRFVVGPDGRAISDSISIVAASNPASTNRAVQSIEQCRFAPGRVAGIPVAVVVFQELTME